MNALVKTSASVGACLLLFLLVRHGETALNPARPRDMPEQAAFAQSGYDMSRLEQKGDWIACGVDAEEQTNWCRVTDALGQVLYQGDFLPLRSNEPVPAGRLNVDRVNPDTMWVQGPSEGSRVPVIPLVGGDMLVPADDRDALADRWQNVPEELARLRSGNAHR